MRFPTFTPTETTPSRFPVLKRVGAEAHVPHSRMKSLVPETSLLWKRSPHIRGISPHPRPPTFYFTTKPIQAVSGLFSDTRKEDVQHANVDDRYWTAAERLQRTRNDMFHKTSAETDGSLLVQPPWERPTRNFTVFGRPPRTPTHMKRRHAHTASQDIFSQSYASFSTAPTHEAMPMMLAQTDMFMEQHNSRYSTPMTRSVSRLPTPLQSIDVHTSATLHREPSYYLRSSALTA